MPNLLTRLFRRSDEISRYTVSDYIRWLQQGRYGLTQPYSYGPTSYANGKPAERIENSYEGYVYGAYKSNPVVFGCMTARSSVFSEARFMWRRIADGRPGDLFSDDSLGVLAKPWPNGTTGELLTRMIQDVDLAGNFYAVHEGDRLRRLRPDWVSIVLSGDPRQDQDVDVLGYVYTPGGPDNGNGRTYLPDELVHWSPIPDPDALYRGMSWLTPVVREIQGDQAAVDHKLAFFRAGATLGPIIKVPPGLTPTQFKDFVANFNAEHQGTENAYRPLVIGNGADVTLQAATMQQLDFKGLQGSSETRLCVAARVPAVIAGVSEGLAGSSLNAGNYGTAKRSFADGCLRPLWRSACAALQSILDVPADAELWYDERDIAFLRDDEQDIAQIQQTQSATINSYVTGGWKPDTAKDAVLANDISKLEHSGAYSVQLQPPGSEDADFDGVPDAETEAGDEYEAALEEFRAQLWDERDEIVRKFNPDQPRDPRGRWSLTSAVIAVLKAQGGEQGGAYFDDGDGRYFDWSSYNPATGEYNLEIGGDISDSDSEVASLAIDDYHMEQLLNSLTVTKLRDSAPTPSGTDDQSVAVATLTAVGHADHIVFPDESYIDWSTRKADGSYGFGVEDADGNAVEFDLTPAELAKLIASLALSTQTRDAARSFIDVNDDDEPGQFVIERKYYDVRFTSGPKGGQFRKISDRVGAALNDYLHGDGGDDDPLEKFTQPQLKQAAKDFGITTPPRAGKAALKLAIFNDAKSRHRAKKDEPTRRASFTLKGGGDATPGRLDIREIGEGLDLDLIPDAVLKAAQDMLDGKATHGQPAGISPAAAGRYLQQWADGPAGPYYRAATLDVGGMNAEESAANSKRVAPEVAKLKRQGDAWAALADRLKATRRSSASTPKGDSKLRDLDVGVYVESKPGSKIYLRRESDGKPSTILQSFDSLDEMASWADGHGESELGDWARLESTGDAPKTDRVVAPSRTKKALDTAEARKAAKKTAPAGLTPREIEVENRIREAYRDIPRFNPAAYVGLADLRDRIGDDVPRAEVDAALRRLARDPRVRVDTVDMGSTFPWSGKKAPLGRRDHEAAVPFGDAPLHMIRFLDDPSPLPTPAKKATPRKAAPKAADFDARVGKATNGRDKVRAAVPVDLENETEARRLVGDDGFDALHHYRGVFFDRINDSLRSDEAGASKDDAVRRVDTALAASALTHDVVVYRGLKDPGPVFGDRLDGDLTGFEWREQSYASTATDENIGKGYANNSQRPGLLMRVVVPGGTHGITMSEGEAELLLERGLTFRVVADHGIKPSGRFQHRMLDVEVVPATPRKAVPPAPGKAGQATKAARDLKPGDSVPSLDVADDEPRVVTHVSKAAGGDIIVHYKDPRTQLGGTGAIRLHGDDEVSLAPGAAKKSATPDLSSLRTLDTEARFDALASRKIGTVDDPDTLKGMLSAAGLKVSGRKGELVDRLVEHLDGTTAAPRPRTEIEDLLDRDLGEPLKRRTPHHGDVAVWSTPGEMPAIGRVRRIGNRTVIEWEGGRSEKLSGRRLDPSVTLYADDRLVEHLGGGAGPKGEGSAEGEAAIRATTVATRSLSSDEVRSLGGYGLESHHNINGGLRAGEGSTDSMRPKHQEMVADIDGLMARSPLSQDIVVYRGLSGKDLTGNAFPLDGDPLDPETDWTGRTWTDHGYSSTSATQAGAKAKTSRVMLRVVVPSGTSAISGSELDPGEVLLQRGLTFRVVRDNGVIGGQRHLDVEIVSDDTTHRSASDQLDDEILRMAVDGDEFQAYWTRGKGWKRWAPKPHPWRTLHRLLLKHPGIHDAEGLASHYFHVVFGYWPGDRKGKNPVGPG